MRAGENYLHNIATAVNITPLQYYSAIYYVKKIPNIIIKLLKKTAKIVKGGCKERGNIFFLAF